MTKSPPSATGTQTGSAHAHRSPLPRALSQALQQAGVAYARGERVKAESLCIGILDSSPECFEALTLLGIILAQNGRLPEAAELLRRAVAANPTLPDAHYNHGNILWELRRLDAALESFERALSLQPTLIGAWVGRGTALQQLGRLEEALISMDRAVALDPQCAEAHFRAGNILSSSGRSEAAAARYARALAARPLFPEAYNNLGTALCALRRFDAAARSCERALELKPEFADAHNNRGVALRGLGRHEAAIASFGQAIALDPSHAEAHANLGDALRQVRRLAEAIGSFDRALALNGRMYSLYGLRLNTHMQLCDWRDHERQVAELAGLLREDLPASSPFAVLIAADCPQLQRQAAQSWVRTRFPHNPLHAAMPRRPGKARIRLGYFSADYHDHATMYLMAQLFELHDRAAFHVTAFSFGPESQSAMRRRLLAGCDDFLDVRDRSEADIARLARERGLDIAVDLKGFTRDSRPGIFAQRAAPLQVAYLGYPGTLGADYIDYLVADRVVIPECHRRHYVEKILYLPGSYQVNDSGRPVSDRVFGRAELGLPATGFVFCCFNHPYKITPAMFDIWIRILRRVEGAVLWLLEDNADAVANLRREAVERGLAPDRLVFAPRLALPEHLARHRVADLFLDTLPCNAHTTASDALWAGLPLLTCQGRAFAGRVAASLLGAVGMRELVTSTLAEYEELAVALATEPERLAQLRRKLAAGRRDGALFDTRTYTKQLESGFARIDERRQSGLAPEDIHVEPA